MDIASGIIGTIAVGAHICNILYKITKATASANADILQLIRHIKNTNDVLEEVQAMLELDAVRSVITIRAEKGFRDAIDECDEVYGAIEKNLAKQTRKLENGDIEVRSTAKPVWFFREEQLEAVGSARARLG